MVGQQQQGGKGHGKGGRGMEAPVIEGPMCVVGEDEKGKRHFFVVTPLRCVGAVWMVERGVWPTCLYRTLLCE